MNFKRDTRFTRELNKVRTLETCGGYLRIQFRLLLPLNGVLRPRRIHFGLRVDSDLRFTSKFVHDLLRIVEFSYK